MEFDKYTIVCSIFPLPIQRLWVSVSERSVTLLTSIVFICLQLPLNERLLELAFYVLGAVVLEEVSSVGVEFVFCDILMYFVVLGDPSEVFKVKYLPEFGAELARSQHFRACFVVSSAVLLHVGVLVDAGELVDS